MVKARTPPHPRIHLADTQPHPWPSSGWDLAHRTGSGHQVLAGGGRWLPWPEIKGWRR
jgi:hypothetical protein